MSEKSQAAIRAREEAKRAPVKVEKPKKAKAEEPVVEAPAA